MTDQESFILMGFLRKLINTRLRTKDPLAEKLINESIAVQPYTNYVLVQRAILLEMELEQLKAQLKELQEQSPQEVRTLSPPIFLGESNDHWGKNLEEPRSSILDLDAKKNTTLEDRFIKFLMKHTIKMWILVLVISIAIFFIRRN
jgi:hypothetical protein